MKIKIRQERTSDYKTVFFLIEKAFENVKESEHTEHFLVSNLRRSKSFIKPFSLVAEIDHKIVGHVLLSKINIKDNDKSTESLALAPLSVLPYYQNKGVGKALILAAHEAAKEMGFKSIIVLGDADYYTKFNYKPAQEFNIQLPFNAPAENCMAIELVKKGLDGVKGMVEYPAEFSK